MTREENNSLMNFLDLASDYLKDGHAGTRAEQGSADGEPVHDEEETTALPLAYTIEEPPDFMYTAEGEGSGEYPAGVSDSPEKAAADIAACRSCGLGAARNRSVPGEGAARPCVMVIGEGPGADEDEAGRPFVGKAGQLLDKMLNSIGLSRDRNCYIANVVKCRPPGNRDPEPGEIAACFPFLERQINFLMPRIILCVGKVAAQSLLKTGKGINALRGVPAEFRLAPRNGEGGPEETLIPVLCTFHPSAVLRNESLKRPAWEDLKLLRSMMVSMGIEAPSEEAQ